MSGEVEIEEAVDVAFLERELERYQNRCKELDRRMAIIRGAAEGRDTAPRYREDGSALVTIVVGVAVRTGDLADLVIHRLDTPGSMPYATERREFERRFKRC